MTVRRPAAVVTGTSTGIGRATALLLDRQGFRVFAGVRREEDGERLRAEASEHLTPVRLDVTERDSVERIVSEVREAVGDSGIAGLVNNAGVTMDGPLEFVDLEEMRRCFEVNTFGPMSLTQCLVPLLRAGRGRIVNVSSGAGLVSAPLLGAYSASKFATEALSDALRVELRRFGIHVVVVQPGSTATEMLVKGHAARGGRMEGRASEDAERYREPMDALARVFESIDRIAVSAEEVAAVIHRALTIPRPRARYRVGRDTRMLAFMAWFLPVRMRDALLGRMLSL